jgi:hypothetical protein
MKDHSYHHKYCQVCNKYCVHDAGYCIVCQENDAKFKAIEEKLRYEKRAHSEPPMEPQPQPTVDSLFDKLEKLVKPKAT